MFISIVNRSTVIRNHSAGSLENLFKLKTIPIERTEYLLSKISLDSHKFKECVDAILYRLKEDLFEDGWKNTRNAKGVPALVNTSSNKTMIDEITSELDDYFSNQTVKLASSKAFKAQSALEDYDEETAKVS